MTKRVAFTVDEDGAGERLDVAVSAHVPEVSRSLARTLLDGGHILVNGARSKPSRRLHAGDRVEVETILRPGLSAAPETLPLSVVYQDADLAVLDKPAGMVVHPSAGHPGGTIANALAALFPQTLSVGAAERPGIVHRLDKDTSGLMVVALTPHAHVSLQEQIASRTAERRYLALASGHVQQREGTIEAPIGRDPRDRKRMAIHGVAARPARTSFHVIEELPGFTYLEAKLHTGRTHQIRVHLAALGHPIAGDSTYHGAKIEGLRRQFLHAYHLSLDSPSTGRRLEFTSPLPLELESVLDELRRAV